MRATLRTLLRAALLAAVCFTATEARASAKASYLHYLKAVLLANQGDQEGAFREFEAAFELDPQSSFVCQQAAELALDMGKTDQALRYAERFVELSPEDPVARFLLGNVHWARGDWRQSQAAFEKTLELKPDFQEALLALGNLLGSQSPDKAKAYLQDYIEKNPENASEAAYQIALMEERAGRMDEAAGYLRTAVEKDPENLQARIQLAQVYEVRHDTEAALGQYLAVIERDGRNVALLVHVGEIYYMKEDLQSAKAFFLKAKEILPSQPSACFWLALLAEQDKDFDEAARQIRESSSLEDDPSLSLRLSYYMTQANRLKEAVEALESGHKKWPENVELAYFLALGYDDLKKPSNAVTLLERVVKDRPEHRDARFQLGALYEKSGSMDKAEVQFREILRVHPNDASSLNYLGYSLADRGLKLEEAQQLIERAVQLDPANGAFLDSLGWVKFKRGDAQASLADLKEARRQLPEDETVWDHLGTVQQALGDPRAAWDAFKRAQTLAPEKTKLRDKLSKIERRMSSKDLGAAYLRYLGDARGDLDGFSGLCQVEGKIGLRTFQFQALLRYHAPDDLGLDILGPLFMPMYRVAVSGRGGFTMDPLRIEGLPAGLLEDRLYKGLSLLRRYLAGGFFQGPAERRKGWRKGAWLSTQDGEVYMDKNSTRVTAVSGGEGVRLELSDYMMTGGHLFPSTFGLEGKGFLLRLRVPTPTVRFEESALSGG